MPLTIEPYFVGDWSTARRNGACILAASCSRNRSRWRPGNSQRASWPGQSVVSGQRRRWSCFATRWRDGPVPSEMAVPTATVDGLPESVFPYAVVVTSVRPLDRKWLIVHWRTSGPSCISRALTANIGSYSGGKPAHRAVSEWRVFRPERAVSRAGV